MADKKTASPRKGHNRWSEPFSITARNNNDLAVPEDCDKGIGRSEIDPDSVVVWSIRQHCRDGGHS
jgi:hypothetical protein